MSDINDVKQTIKTALPSANIDVFDFREDGLHYALHVRAKEFSGKSQLDQHRLVFKVLSTYSQTHGTAFSLQTEAVS